ESKGIVERRNGFFETSFMPGRDFTSPGDFDAQFAAWLTKANNRVVRTIKARPVDLLDADRAAMLPLPPVAPVLGWVNRVRLGRDYYVRLDSCDYSVDPAVIGRFIDVTADLARVEVRHEGRLVAAHDRAWARGMTLTDPAHVAAAKVLREQFQRPQPPPNPDDGMARDLGDYDRAFGLIDGARTDGQEVA
ncbi:MAG: IS21 family transposase, partial [Ornithinimicrobium sp.]